jgi:putative transposase
MEWARILAYITGTVDHELLLRNEYLAAENRILRGQLKGRLKFSDAERAKLGEIGRRLGRKALGEVATAALPDTILAWYRRLVARKFDGSQKRRTPGRPRINREVEELIVRMAEENRSWGYDRIVGALANLGHEVSDQTVGNVLQRHGLPAAPERKHTTTWATFIRAHLAVLAGTDFFTAEVLTLRGLVTYYVLFFIHLESRKVDIAGITVHPNERWMQQMARNVTMEGCGTLRDCRYLLHDRDTKYTTSSGSTSTAKSGMFSTSSLMRASNFTVPTTPTLRPRASEKEAPQRADLGISRVPRCRGRLQNAANSTRFLAPNPQQRAVRHGMVAEGDEFEPTLRFATIPNRCSLQNRKNR